MTIAPGCKVRHPWFAVGAGWVWTVLGQEDPEQELRGGRVLAFAECGRQATAGDLGLGHMFKSININILRKRLGPYPLCIKETSRFLAAGLTRAADVFWCAGESAPCTDAASLWGTDSRLSPGT